MVSEQVTRAWRILSAMAMISASLVLRAAMGVRGRMLTLDGDDELGDDRQHLGASLLEHVEHTLYCEEAVGVLLLTDALEEDGQVVVVVQLLDLHLPVDLVLGTVLNCNGQVTSVVEPSELTSGDQSLLESSSFGLLGKRAVLRLVETSGLASKSFSFLQNG
jgi:hypothetical protein